MPEKNISNILSNYLLNFGSGVKIYKIRLLQENNKQIAKQCLKTFLTPNYFLKTSHKLLMIINQIINIIIYYFITNILPEIIYLSKCSSYLNPVKINITKNKIKLKKINTIQTFIVVPIIIKPPQILYNQINQIKHNIITSQNPQQRQHHLSYINYTLFNYIKYKIYQLSISIQQIQRQKNLVCKKGLLFYPQMRTIILPIYLSMYRHGRRNWGYVKFLWGRQTYCLPPPKLTKQKTLLFGSILQRKLSQTILKSMCKLTKISYGNF
eukprot:TRINITY_DN14171_c1_g1_i1.p2 TRINITY_DN14171_c1_g1~~TRINITY_DN14171_c1_g1_i1.p2  ORF type:complete len:267 (-),score=-17.86 TRINITY_DN14171_c1_g1_i1:551-1351(-)